MCQKGKLESSEAWEEFNQLLERDCMESIRRNVSSLREQTWTPSWQPVKKQSWAKGYYQQPELAWKQILPRVFQGAQLAHTLISVLWNLEQRKQPSQNQISDFKKGEIRNLHCFKLLKKPENKKQKHMWELYCLLLGVRKYTLALTQWILFIWELLLRVIPNKE